jgi:choline monooxygenase
VTHVVPVGQDRTFEIYDVFFETAEPTAQEMEAFRYNKDALPREDIDIGESVQRRMSTPAFERDRIVHEPAGSGES